MTECKIVTEKKGQDTIVKGYQEDERGSKHGAFVAKKNGVLLEEGFYQYGRPHGLWIYYKENGQISEKIMWENGFVKGGISYENGQPKSVEILTTYSQKVYRSNTHNPFSSNSSYFGTVLKKEEPKRPSDSSYFSTTPTSSYLSTNRNLPEYSIVEKLITHDPNSEKAKKYMEKISKTESEQRPTWEDLWAKVNQAERTQTATQSSLPTNKNPNTQRSNS